MVERSDQIRQILGHLVDGRDRWGAAVVSRDGIAVATHMTRPVSEETFSAMSAALIAAAEGAMREFADDRPRRATVEGLGIRLSIEGLDNDFFLAVATPMAPNPIMSHALEIDAAATRLRAVLTGGPAVTATAGVTR
jgi:predicted regulator of Ras-like GTPase activity (Roadblock/LC7/MglB family)